MKNIFITILCILLHFLCYAEKPKVVCSASMFSDMVKEIAGDLVDLETIVPIGGDPHLHDPTPRDARIVAKANLILINGLTFEGWITELIENSGTKGKIGLITEGINAIQSERYQGSTDPHAWMTASNGRIYIKNILSLLKEILPDHVEILDQKFDDYDKQLADLDIYIQQKIESIPVEKRILITSHDAFAYYGKYYGIQLEPIIGISTEAEAQTSDIRRVGEAIRNNKVPAVFVESTINPKLLEQIAKDNDIIIGGELFADSLGDKVSPASTYLNMLKHNTDTIYKGLVESNESFTKEKEQGQSTIWIYALMGLVLIGGFFILIKKIA